MSTTIADPLFVRAEVQYRTETWGTHGPDRSAVWPDVTARLRRRLHRRLAAALSRRDDAVHHPAGGTAVHRPRHS